MTPTPLFAYNNCKGVFFMLHNIKKSDYFLNIASKQRPYAMSVIRGSNDYPNICGVVKFYKSPFGILVMWEISGLPHDNKMCGNRIFAMHIHEGTSCSGNASDPFANAKTHYNPGNCPHPWHAGDLPPLFENCGFAFGMVLTDRFCLDDIIGRTVIIHDNPDDFTTQPAGNSGSKIACGIIAKL